MERDNDQGNLWEQSDLLQLMATGERDGTPAGQQPGRVPISGQEDGGELPEAPARDAPRNHSDAPPGPPPPASPARKEPEPAQASPQAAPALSGAASTGAGEPSWAEAPVAADRAHPCVDALDESAPPTVAPAGQGSDGTRVRPVPLLSLANRAADTGRALQRETGPADDTGLPACPQRLLILDTETTGLSPEQAMCIEVGAVLFDVASRAVLMQVSFLLPCERNPAQHVNGIPAAVSRLSQPWRSGLLCFEAMVANADALLAHNAAFDRQWFGIGELPALVVPWICSMEDIRWPAQRQLRPSPSVRDLALAYGVPVWAAHRALTDCIYLVQVFQRCDDLESLLRAALEPRRLVRARLSYDERQLAKDAGFRWNEPVPKAWSRRLSEREIAALPFPVDPVETGPFGEHSPSWRRQA